MTLEQLNEHYSLVEKYITAQTVLQRLRDAAGLKAQSMTGMPHGSGVSDTVGNMAVEIVRTEEKLAELSVAVHESQAPIEQWIDGVDDCYAQTVLRLRFIHGMKWSEIATIMGGGNTDQSIKALCYRLAE